VSVYDAYRGLASNGVMVYPKEEALARLRSIAEYLGTTDPIELGAAYLLELAGCERGREQLALALALGGDERDNKEVNQGEFREDARAA
jgi:hypothetical protein